MTTPEPNIAPDDSLYRLLYVSTARRSFKDQELETLLEQARRNNYKNGVTGMLIYVGGNFVQYVEGPRHQVEALIGRLERDTRHHGVIRLVEGPTERRIFSDWSMGYRWLAKNESHKVLGALDLAKQTLRSSLPANMPQDLVMFMERFYRSSLGLRAHEAQN